MPRFYRATLISRDTSSLLLPGLSLCRRRESHVVSWLSVCISDDLSETTDAVNDAIEHRN